MHQTIFRQTSVIATLGLVFVLGCGSADRARLPVYPTSGRLSVGGKPVQGVSVVLNPIEGSPAARKGLSPSATSDESGGFVISTYAQDDGAPAGEYKVTLQWMRTESSTPNGPPAGFSAPRDKFEGRFRNPTVSTWSTKIEEGNNVLEHLTID
jgi:hypothetical protein